MSKFLNSPCYPDYCGVAGKGRYREMAKYRSYCITISTLEPVEGEAQKTLTNWLKKQDYAYGVIEGGEGKEQERHLHAQVWYESAREKGTLNKALKRIVEKHFPESKPHIAIKIKIAYNDDFLEKYMTKDPTEKVIDLVPLEQKTIEVDKYGEFGEKETKIIFRKDYYPTQEEQDKVKAKSKVIDHKMNQLEELFYEWVGEEPEPDNELLKKAQVSRFLSDMMYRSRKIKVPTDMKIQRNLCSVFTNYLWQKSDSFMLLSQEEQKLLEQEINNQQKDI